MTVKSKILIVDDKEENLFSMVQILKGEEQEFPPVEVFTATSGNEALKIALYHDFALIILDVHMPEMDGFELAKLLRGKKETEKVPIIFLTAEYKTVSAVFKGYETGAVDFLVKPLDPRIIISKVKTFVELDQQKIEIEKQREWLQITLSSIGDAVIAADVNGIINFINPVAEKLTEWYKQEAMGQNIKNVFPIINEHSRKAVENPLDIALKKGQVSGLANDTILITRHKKEIYIDDSAAPIKINGSIQGAILVFRDITNRKKMEKSLILAKKEADSANQAKSAFLTNMSHELRTPLNSIIGFTGIMLMGIPGEINAEQKKQLTMAKSSANHLLNLINDILDISKVESGKVDISVENFYINELVQEIAEGFKPLVNEKGIELVEEKFKKQPINSDRKFIKQILLNLISNAVKFTDQGSVKIELSTSKKKHIDIRIIDTGIGIKAENQSKVFEKFKQIDMSSTKEYEGTGLGLYLSKELANLIGGKITVKSEYGKGSEFTLHLPLKYGD